MSLGLTQPLAEVSTRNINWKIKMANAYGIQVSTVQKSGNLKLLEHSWHVEALFYLQQSNIRSIFV